MDEGNSSFDWQFYPLLDIPLSCFSFSYLFWAFRANKHGKIDGLAINYVFIFIYNDYFGHAKKRW